MRRTTVISMLAAALILIPLNSSAGTVVNISNAYISIEVPTGWTFERNATVSGVIYDLAIMGPMNDGILPIAMLGHIPWSGEVSNSKLWAQLDHDLEDLYADPDVSAVIVVSDAVNRTIGGVDAIDMTVEVVHSGVSIREREVVLASDAWNMGWGITVAIVASGWEGYDSTIDAMINSLSVEEAPTSDGSLILLGIGVLIAVIVAVIAAAVLHRRGRPDNALTPPPVLPLTPPTEQTRYDPLRPPPPNP